MSKTKKKLKKKKKNKTRQEASKGYFKTKLSVEYNTTASQQNLQC